MKEEVTGIVRMIEVSDKYTFFGMDYYKGHLGGEEVVVGMTGVGKVMAAMITQKLSDLFKPKGIIFSGIAGALNPALDIGDLVVSKECLQHDMDASSLGFKIGEIPYTGVRVLESDKSLHDKAMMFKLEGIKVISGRILTGDQFINTSSDEKRKFLKDELQGDAVEMEGASVAFTAFMNKIPFLLIRVISDRADGNAPSDFKKFLKRSSILLSKMVFHILQNQRN
jgi:5'-methylthioadenosine/S-adenosylhomocysteine nucleosidase